jgi:hypothetical protein
VTINPGFAARAFAMALLAAFAGLSAAQARPADPADLAQVNSIGVICALGNTITLLRSGTSKTDKTGSSETAFASTGWDLDQQVIAYVSDQLMHRYVIQKVVYDPAQLANFDARNSEMTLGPISSKNPVSAFLVVVPREVSDTGLPRDVTLKGFGLFRHYRLLRRPQTILFAGYEMLLIDTNDFKVIASGRSMLPGNFAGAPERYAKAALWTENGAAPSADQKQELQQRLTKLVLDSLPHTLDALALTP